MFVLNGHRANIDESIAIQEIRAAVSRLAVGAGHSRFDTRPQCVDFIGRKYRFTDQVAVVTIKTELLSCQPELSCHPALLSLQY